MASVEFLAGTADGIRGIRLNPNGTACVTSCGLSGHAVRGIAIDPENPDRFYVAAGLRGYGLYVTEDSGKAYHSLGFEDRWVWDVVVDTADTSRVLIGTEPPMLYETPDRGRSWRAFPTIDEVESRNRWTFFHPPFHAGHLHGIAITPHRPARILVGVEHGGLLRSTDNGDSWTDVMPGADLHRIAIDPADPDRIYTGAGNGLFISQDGGERWEPVEALRGRYVHGIVFDPMNADRIFVYIDSRTCPVVRSDDRGTTWESIGVGLPRSRPADPLRMHNTWPGVVVYAGDTDEGSEIYLSTDYGQNWFSTGLELPKVWRLATVPR